MRKLLFLAILITASASMAFAQDDYNKVEFHAGYSHARVDTGVGDDEDFSEFFSDRRGYNGFSTSVTGNFSRYVGVKGELSGYFKNDSFTDGGITVNTRERLWYFLGGVQIKDNSKEKRFKPFAHALVGAARQDFRLTAPIIADSFEDDDTSFALKVGGGLDIRLNRRIDLRAVELNYAPVFVGDRTIDGVTFGGGRQHNVTIGAGIVIH